MIVTANDILNVYKFGYCDFNFDIIIDKDIANRKIDFNNAKLGLKTRIYDSLIRAKKPISILLSGGIDSTFLYCMLRNCFEDKDIVPITIAYNESFYNETLNNIKTNLFVIDKTIINEVLERITVDTYKNIFSTSSLIPTYTALKFASVNSNTIVTGDGGDEIFCGYDKYLLPFIKYRDSKRRIAKLKSYLVNGYPSAISSSIDSIFPFNNALEYIMNIDGLNKMEKLMLFDRKTELVKLEIPKVETAARMANVNNIISPFLDKVISDYVVSLPTKYKYKNGIRKRILRSILKEEGIKISNRKKGFNVPIDEWIGGEVNWTSTILDILFKKEIIKVKG